MVAPPLRSRGCRARVVEASEVLVVALACTIHLGCRSIALLIDRSPAFNVCTRGRTRRRIKTSQVTNRHVVEFHGAVGVNVQKPNDERCGFRRWYQCLRIQRPLKVGPARESVRVRGRRQPLSPRKGRPSARTHETRLQIQVFSIDGNGLRYKTGSSLLRGISKCGDVTA